ncbi:MAG: hypothetical protein R2747_02070 [Pyrinomonadaceae bacterium]
MRLFLSILALLIFSNQIFTQTTAEKSRQFDFWVGEWDVNLRVQQADKTWRDQHKSVARIYSILDGKAILELWSESKEGINGYSLRYFNPQKNKWDLWLNWAGKNRSGTNGLDGEFRHGRGEFFFEQPLPGNMMQIARYTFSDITPDSLRWDDAYSRDGGKTWAGNWIMEFTRRALQAPPIGSEKKLHTYFDGTRCDLPQFNALKELSANQPDKPEFRLYNILDGCIVIGFIEKKKRKSFFSLTFNTFANLYELAFLDDRDQSALALFYGQKTSDGFALKSKDGKENAVIKAGKKIDSLEIDYEGDKEKFGF